MKKNAAILAEARRVLANPRLQAWDILAWDRAHTVVERQQRGDELMLHLAEAEVWIVVKAEADQR